MCLIIDANFVHRVFPSPDADGLPIQRALVSGGARLVYGGQLSREYGRMMEFRRLLVGLDRAGHARKVPDVDVDRATERLERAGGYISNDPHIIALAQVSGVRLLCSNDGNLHADFTNHAFLNTPRGQVYQTAIHAPLIRQHCAQLMPGPRREGRPSRSRPRIPRQPRIPRRRKRRGSR